MITAAVSKKEFSIPVRVVASDAGHVIQPPVTLHPAGTSPSLPKKNTVAAKTQHAVKQFTSATSIERRRQLLWPLVGAGMVVIVTAWGMMLRYELRSSGQKNIFAEVSNLIKKYKPASQPRSTTSKEIESLSKWVFPQFQSK